MKKFAILAFVLGSVLATTGATLACEEFVDLSTSELKEFRDKLSEPEADSLDRLYAFEQMVCSSNPNIRSYAITEGLKSSTDTLVRNQIMFEALMQKTRLDIELTVPKGANSDDKKFVAEYSGIWSGNVIFISREKGCLSIEYSDRCDPDFSFFVRGGKAEFKHHFSKARGEFQLTEQNELVGFVLYKNGGTKIPAIIKLN